MYKKHTMFVKLFGIMIKYKDKYCYTSTIFHYISWRTNIQKFPCHKVANAQNLLHTEMIQQ